MPTSGEVVCRRRIIMALPAVANFASLVNVDYVLRLNMATKEK